MTAENFHFSEPDRLIGSPFNAILENLKVEFPKFNVIRKIGLPISPENQTGTLGTIVYYKNPENSQISLFESSGLFPSLSFIFSGENVESVCEIIQDVENPTLARKTSWRYTVDDQIEEVSCDLRILEIGGKIVVRSGEKDVKIYPRS